MKFLTRREMYKCIWSDFDLLVFKVIWRFSRAVKQININLHLKNKIRHFRNMSIMHETYLDVVRASG